MIPAVATIVLCVAGVDAVGRLLDERYVHRPERAAAITGVPLGAPIMVVAYLRGEPPVASVVRPSAGGGGGPEATIGLVSG